VSRGPLFLAILAVGGLFAGCERDKRAEVDDIARLFVALRVESRTWEGQPERAREAREKLLRTAGMTLPEWRSRVRALQSDPDLWAPFWDKAKQITDSIDNHAKLPKSKGS
jgi:hypothetical protein